MTHLQTITTTHKFPPQAYIPSTISWGLDDRVATFRVMNSGPSSTYVENRLPSGLVNPYLALAACVCAGLDGIEEWEYFYDIYIFVSVPFN